MYRFGSGISTCDVSSMYKPLFDAAIESKDWAQADEILAHISSHMMQPSIHILSKYLCALTRNFRIVKAIDLIESIYSRKLGIVLNERELMDVSCCILEECSRMGLADDALWLIERMRGMQMRPNLRCWELLAEALCVASRFEEAFDTINVKIESMISFS